MIFILGVICVFRVAFIVWLHSYLSEVTTVNDVLVALYYGVRISLKSAGLMTLASFVLCTVVQHAVSCRQSDNIRLLIGTVYISILSVLFYARIPYYEQFHSGFNQLLFNTFQDDVYALFHTLIQQYHLPLRLTMAIITAMILAKLLQIWLGTAIITLPQFSRWYHNIAIRAIFLTAVYYLVIFIRFGGSLTYAYNVDWENSGVTKDRLLNEAVLDDVQALYRAYELHERLSESTGLEIDPAKMAEYGMYVAGRPLKSNNLDDYLEKTAQGSSIQQPKHIFLIIGESYANWPLLPQYQDLNVANGLRNIIKQDDAAYVRTFLPNGMSTISGVLGIVTGFTDANLYVNCLPEAYRQPYPTAIAPQMKRLGYQAKFWYAGPSSWERIKDFTLAQGFDEFYGLGDYESDAGNVWGCDDKYLFSAILARVKAETPSFNVILTVSNHAPYTVDLQAEGFDQEQIVAGLPDKHKNNKELIKQLGHFWYADKVMAEFIDKARKRYPDSLFIIVGDHADRLNLDANPSLYERYGIPLVVHGQGVTKDVFSKQAAGSHINITPTLIELVAPKGFRYSSLGQSLTRGNDFGMNYGFWITSDYIGKADSDYAEAIEPSSVAVQPNREKVEKDITALRAISWWRIKNGNQLLH